jgi:hypothetical protein
MKNREQLESLLNASTLWSKDRWGNYKAVTSKGEYRIVLKDKVIRLERKVEIESYNENRWFNVQSNFYGKVKVDADKRLVLISGSKAIKL